MSTTAIGLGGVAAALVLIVVAVALSFWQKLHLERSILWAATRAAVQKEQVRLGLPADGWPTMDLLGAL